MSRIIYGKAKIQIGKVFGSLLALHNAFLLLSDKSIEFLNFEFNDYIALINKNKDKFLSKITLEIVQLEKTILSFYNKQMFILSGLEIFENDCYEELMTLD